MAVSSIAGAMCAGKSDFEADDSGAIEHQVEPATADEVEAEIAVFFEPFTAPRLTRDAR